MSKKPQKSLQELEQEVVAQQKVVDDLVADIAKEKAAIAVATAAAKKPGATAEEIADNPSRGRLNALADKQLTEGTERNLLKNKKKALAKAKDLTTTESSTQPGAPPTTTTDVPPLRTEPPVSTGSQSATATAKEDADAAEQAEREATAAEKERAAAASAAASATATTTGPSAAAATTTAAPA